jgi:hypothetical protein
MSARDENDPVAQRMLSFVDARVTLHRLEGGGTAGVDYLAGVLAHAEDR